MSVEVSSPDLVLEELKKLVNHNPHIIKAYGEFGLGKETGVETGSQSHCRPSQNLLLSFRDPCDSGRLGRQSRPPYLAILDWHLIQWTSIDVVRFG